MLDCLVGYWSLFEKQLGRGTLIDKRNGGLDNEECPFCGLRWHIAYLDDEWKGNQSSPDDAFECPSCGAVGTRRDYCGAWEDQEWEKDNA